MYTRGLHAAIELARQGGIVTNKSMLKRMTVYFNENFKTTAKTTTKEAFTQTFQAANQSIQTQTKKRRKMSSTSDSDSEIIPPNRNVAVEIHVPPIPPRRIREPPSTSFLTRHRKLIDVAVLFLKLLQFIFAIIGGTFVIWHFIGGSGFLNNNAAPEAEQEPMMESIIINGVDLIIRRPKVLNITTLGLN